MISEEKEAIEELKILKEDYWEDDGYGYATAECQKTITALDMAIEALEQQPCEDVISRDCDKCAYYDNGANNEACDECFADEYEHPNFKPKAQPCNDCISRQAVLDAINTYDKFGYTETGCFVREPEGDYVPYIHYDDVIKCIKNAPPVTPKEKTGHWVKTPKAVMGEGYMWYCDKCEHQVYQDSSRDYPSEKYCPNCGAKMQEVGE